MNRKNLAKLCRIGLLTFAVIAAGCFQQRSSKPSTVMVVRQSPKPALAARRDAQVTLFGGLPRRGEGGFRGRAMGSMLQHSFAREGADFDIRLDRSGERFVFSSTRHSPNPDIYIKSVDGTAVTQLTLDSAADLHPQLSPDGKYLAFASNRTGNWDIWVIGLGGQKPIQVTNSPMDEMHPSWSPDGSRIVYCARPAMTGQWELWIAPAQKNATPTYIGVGVFPEWSPVDDTILFQRSRQRGSRWFSVWTVQLIGNEPRYPTELVASADFAAILPSWSHDGMQIAYTTVSSVPDTDPEFGAMFERADIWVVDSDGGNRIRLTDGLTQNFGPAWSPDGRVFFTSSRSGHENIWSVLPSTAPASDPPMTGVVRRQQLRRGIRTVSDGPSAGEK